MMTSEGGCGSRLKETARTGNALALLFIALLAGMQLYWFDITIHGPDQIRDMEVARRLALHGEWPQSGPPMFGERITLPPGFYWLLALPLWLHDSDASVFIAFGLLYGLSALYIWRQVSHIQKTILIEKILDHHIARCASMPIALGRQG